MHQLFTRLVNLFPIACPPLVFTANNAALRYGTLRGCGMLRGNYLPAHTGQHLNMLPCSVSHGYLAQSDRSHSRDPIT